MGGIHRARGSSRRRVSRAVFWVSPNEITQRQQLPHGGFGAPKS